MVTRTNPLEDYEEAIENLLGEIREYQAVNTTLQGMAAKLSEIQEVNAAAGKSLWSIGAEASQVLKSVKELHLDQMETRADQRYTSHQSALESLNDEIRSAVREQQRLGLEMLQHTIASQKEFAAFVKQTEQLSTDARDRELSIQEQMKALSSTTASDMHKLDRQIIALRRIMLAAIVLIVVAGIASFMR